MMMGVAILAMFSALWGVLALAAIHAPWSLYGLPVAISLALLFVARRVLQDAPARSPADRKRIGRLVAIWSSAEGIGIFVAVNIVINLHRRDLVLAAMCAVVGAHFLPLARGMPRRSYYLTGLAMLLLAAGGLVMPAIVPPFVVGMGAAIIMWATLFEMLYSERGPRHGGRPRTAA